MASVSPPLHDVVGSGHALMEVMKETAVCCLHAMCHKLPYSGKFSLVQNFTVMCPDSSEEIFAVFIFTEQT